MGGWWKQNFPSITRLRSPSPIPSGCIFDAAFEQGRCSFMSWNLPWKTWETESLSRIRFFVTPMDCGAPGSSVLGILQARILEWVAISFFRGSSWPRDRTHVSRIAGRRFNLWATRGAPRKKNLHNPHLSNANITFAFALLLMFSLLLPLLLLTVEIMARAWILPLINNKMEIKESLKI